MIEKPRLVPGRKPGRFVLLESYRWRDLLIPAGFESDLDTVPRIPVFHAIFKGRTAIGALVHDYALLHFERAVADRLFLQAMTEEGVRRRYRYPIYAAVRAYAAISEIRARLQQFIASTR